MNPFDSRELIISLSLGIPSGWIINRVRSIFKVVDDVIGNAVIGKLPNPCVMNHYETPVPKAVAENPRFLKFRRRLLSPRLNNPQPYTRRLKLLSHGLAIICSVNIVFFAEFPSGHCFTGIREWYAQKRMEFLRLSAQDQLGTLIFNQWNRILCGCIDRGNKLIKLGRMHS